MPRARYLFALLAVAGLILAGCGNDDADDAATNGDPGAAQNGNADLPEARDDVPDGVAATVGSAEIDIETVEDIYDEIAASPAISEQLEGEPDQTQLMESMLRAQVLSQLVIQEIVAQGASEDFGIEVTTADLEEALEELEAEAGGQDEFETQLEAVGLTRDVFIQMELPLTVVLDELQDEFGDLTTSPDDEPGEFSEGQQQLQEWGLSKFLEADVAVSADYGTWNPQSGQVEPPGMPQMPPPGDMPAPEDEDEDEPVPAEPQD